MRFWPRNHEGREIGGNGAAQAGAAPQGNPFLSLGAKTFYLMSFLVLVSLGANSWQNTRSFSDLLQRSVEGDMIIQAREASRGLESFLDGVISRLAVAASLAKHGDAAARADAEGMMARLLASDQSIVAVQSILEGPTGALESVSLTMTPDHEAPAFGDEDPVELAAALPQHGLGWLRDELARSTRRGHPFLRNVSAELGLPILLLGVPFTVKSSHTHLWQLVLVWQANAAAPLATGEHTTSRALDEDGHLITSPTAGELTTAATQTPVGAGSLLQDALSRHVQAGFGKAAGPDGTMQFAAYARLPRFSAVVLIQRDAGLVEQAVRSIVIRSLLWSWLFVLVAVMLSFLSSRRITRTVREVTAATHKISSGDFSTKIVTKGHDEVALMGSAVNRMSTRIVELLHEAERKAVLEHELETARLLQTTFFPKTTAAPGATYSVRGLYQPAEKCSGDWWSHFSCGEGLEFICVGDVMGHGAAAALVTAMAYTMSQVFRSRQGAGEAGGTTSPAALLRWMNDVLTEALDGSVTMTFAAMVLDSRSATLTFATAAHTPPLLLRRGENGEWSNTLLRPDDMDKGGQPLGLTAGYDYGDTTFKLTPGDRVLVYTDGIIECAPEGGKNWGSRRFAKAAIKHAGGGLDDFAASMMADAKEYCAGASMQDDVTMVVVEYAGEAVASGAPPASPVAA